MMYKGVLKQGSEQVLFLQGYSALKEMGCLEGCLKCHEWRN